MDDRTRKSRDSWEALSAAGVEYARPWLDLTPAEARERVDPEAQLASVEGKRVLCLAASGGQQSAAFALLGAHVTVFDFSENQLRKDRATADHYGLSIETIHGDMQDLSRFATAAFDIVWLAHSINFVPNATRVIAQVSRICSPGGRLRINFTNPYVHGTWDSFQEGGYLLSQRYIDGGEVSYGDRSWRFTGDDGREHRINGPAEYRHRLSTIMNGLIAHSFEILGFWESVGDEPAPEPGSWEHFTTIAPPWLTIWALRREGKGESTSSAVSPANNGDAR